MPADILSPEPAYANEAARRTSMPLMRSSPLGGLSGEYRRQLAGSPNKRMYVFRAIYLRSDTNRSCARPTKCIVKIQVVLRGVGVGD